ncbi:hypothetical protein B484DRAFT_449899 [Ochromonadaceae sp. CCMP2298]|nr:hypothetical protein B484DRAFT_449899 [Ochromonadaceae sp. CCMP2298]
MAVLLLLALLVLLSHSCSAFQGTLPRCGTLPTRRPWPSVQGSISRDLRMVMTKATTPLSGSVASPLSDGDDDDLIAALTGSRVLVLGDGDFSFSRSLSGKHICSLTATTLDSRERLCKSFPDAASNVAFIEGNGDAVLYGVNATNIRTGPGLFDVILWNFPHVVGRQNIRYNRDLLRRFLQSAGGNGGRSGGCDGEGQGGDGGDGGGGSSGGGSGLLAPGGRVIVSLCGGQSGTRAKCREDWNRSWKLSLQAAEAGLVLCGGQPFESGLFAGYRPMGHRGHGGGFLLGEAEVFTLQPVPVLEVVLESVPVSVSATVPVVVQQQDQHQYQQFQSPLYVHEVHLVALAAQEGLWDSALSLLDTPAKVAVFEARAEAQIESILTLLGATSVLWSVRLCDVYPHPQSGSLTQVLQVGYCSQIPLGRAGADLYRAGVEEMLPAALGMRARDEKHGGCVSQAYGWYVAQALRAADISRYALTSTPTHSTHSTPTSTPSTHLHTHTETSHSPNSDTSESPPTLEQRVRTLARGLWRLRVGVLAHGEKGTREVLKAGL